MNIWDERFSQDEYLYGTEPNTFLSENFSYIPKGKVLSLGEGEGRNAVFLAQKGYDVTAVDYSSVGLAKAAKLAHQRKVKLKTILADLQEYEPGENNFDGIISFFCHMPVPEREALHEKAVQALKPGGIFLIEGYTIKQLEFKTGGPRVSELLMSLTQLRKELTGLEFIKANEIEREVHEGKMHTGKAAVVQIIAKKIV